MTLTPGSDEFGRVKETDKTTPRPWGPMSAHYANLIMKDAQGIADGHDSYVVCEARHHSLISETEANANAAFIVTAVNAHDGLVKALLEARRQLQLYEKDVTGEDYNCVDIDAALKAAGVET